MLSGKDFGLVDGWVEADRECLHGWCDKIKIVPGEVDPMTGVRSTVEFCSVQERKIGGDELLRFPEGCSYGK